MGKPNPAKTNSAQRSVSALLRVQVVRREFDSEKLLQQYSPNPIISAGRELIM